MRSKPVQTPEPLDTLEIIGGHPAADFVNTVHSWQADPPPDYLHDFDDFIDWNRVSGLLGRRPAAHFKSAPKAQKAKAYGVAIALRGSMHRILTAIANGLPLPEDALEDLNEVIRRTTKWRRLAADEATGGTTLCCVWDFSDAPAVAALGPVAWAAVDLLEKGPLERVKVCPGDRCGWLFVDSSKNRSRTWCSMKTCGNAAKVKRFRKRAEVRQAKKAAG
jgi:predicted RNA-binding Zn ribbon-like protein